MLNQLCIVAIILLFHNVNCGIVPLQCSVPNCPPDYILVTNETLQPCPFCVPKSNATTMTTVMPTEDTRKDKLCREIFCFPGYELTTTELSPDGCPYCKIIAVPIVKRNRTTQETPIIETKNKDDTSNSQTTTAPLDNVTTGNVDVKILTDTPGTTPTEHATTSPKVNVTTPTKNTTAASKDNAREAPVDNATTPTDNATTPSTDNITSPNDKTTKPNASEITTQPLSNANAKSAILVKASAVVRGRTTTQAPEDKNVIKPKETDAPSKENPGNVVQEKPTETTKPKEDATNAKTTETPAGNKNEKTDEGNKEESNKDEGNKKENNKEGDKEEAKEEAKEQAKEETSETGSSENNDDSEE